MAGAAGSAFAAGLAAVVCGARGGGGGVLSAVLRAGVALVLGSGAAVGFVRAGAAEDSVFIGSPRSMASTISASFC